jgi:hypothetical protein
MRIISCINDKIHFENIRNMEDTYLGMRLQLVPTFPIRIVADCVALFCQVTQKLKRAATFEFTTDPAIIFIHC